MVVAARVAGAADGVLEARDGDVVRLLQGRHGDFGGHVLADPDVAVDAENDIDGTPPTRGVDGPDLPSRPDDPATTAGAADGQEHTIAQFPVLEAARVQARRAVLVDGLHLRHQQVTLAEKGADG